MEELFSLQGEELAKSIKDSGDRVWLEPHHKLSWKAASTEGVCFYSADFIMWLTETHAVDHLREYLDR